MHRARNLQLIHIAVARNNNPSKGKPIIREKVIPKGQTALRI
tara:strand:- start:1 stop:126 length:126 start_codon:yes stop_codon:yes gene_type:complete